MDQQSGLPAISKEGATVITSNFVFWGKNWAWATLSKEFKVNAPYEYSIVGTDQALNFTLKGYVTKPSNRQLVWNFDLDASRETPDVIGGGISFKLDLANFGSELGQPELLPDNRGWTWGRREDNRIEMYFDPPAETVVFERGQKSEIRAFFYKGAIPAGHRHYVATLNISGDVAISPTIAEQFGLDDAATWPTDILDWKAAPVDLSFLNTPEKPAGKHGFLTTAKDKLVFEDGTTVRFWGTNLSAYALFQNETRRSKTPSASPVGAWLQSRALRPSRTRPGSPRISSATGRRWIRTT